MKKNLQNFGWIVFVLFYTTNSFSKEFHWKSQKGTLHAGVLEGNYYEMGKQAAKHSELEYKDTMAYEINRIYNDYFKIVSNTYLLRGIIKSFMDYKYIHRMSRRIPKEDKDMNRGIADYYGVRRKELYKSYVTPDSFHGLVLDLMRIRNYYTLKKSEKNTHRKYLSRFLNCSSFSVHGDKAKNGERLIGRNLDYMGIGVYDKATSVYLMKPKKGYRHLIVSPLGYPIAGISGMNEHGLAVMAHSVLADKFKVRKSKPMLSVNRMVLTKAKTIDEAYKIYNKNPVFSGWMMHLSDRDPKTNKPRSAIVELHPRGNTIRWDENNYNVLTNNYINPKHLKHDIELYQGSIIHNRDRYKRLHVLVKKGVYDLNKAVSILQDSWSPYSKSKVNYSPSSIMVPNQINSVIFIPDELKLMVSEGPSPSSYSSYYTFSFDQMEARSAPKVFTPKVKAPSEGLKYYTLAYEAAVRFNDDKKVFEYLKEAYELSDDCSFDLIYASYLIKKGDLVLANTVLDDAAVCEIYNPQQTALVYFLKGMLVHLDGSQEEAKKLYEKADYLSPSKEFAKALLEIAKKTKLELKEVIEHADIDMRLMDSMW